jgi:hypothetical protein
LVTLNGARLSVGFSGFRGKTDLEIMVNALEEAEEVEVYKPSYAKTF